MRHLIRCAVLGGALALFVAGGAFAKSETVRVGNLSLTHDGGISPTVLPRHEQAPIDAFISAAIATIDGSHPPAAREAALDLDKDVARKVCGGAIVGRGSARVEIAFPEQGTVFATSPLTMFNGGVRGGKTTIFIHAYLTVPVPAAVVTPVVLTPIRSGPYGTHIVAKVPAIAGGSGSLIDAKLKIDRKFTYRGEQRSYLTAACPTGAQVIRGRVLFDDDTLVRLSRLLPCTQADRQP